MDARVELALAVFLLPPASAAADMVSPGVYYVPRDLVIDVENEHSGFRFWLASERGIEPLLVAPSRACRVDGTGRVGGHRDAFVIAAPVGRVEQLVRELGPTRLWQEIYAGRTPPGVVQSELIDFYATVPFWDSRDRVVDQFRLEFGEPSQLRLVWVRQNAGDWRIKLAWVASGIGVAVGLAWAAWRVIRSVARAGELSMAKPAATPDPARDIGSESS